MSKYIIPEKNIHIDGELSFQAGKEYKVHNNGTSRVNNEFVVSDLTGRGTFLLSLSGDYMTTNK